MPSDAIEPDPAQFYTGLVAELYEPLASERATADRYAPFLDRYGTPALELACGSGWPLLDLVDRGYDVDGLDTSADMLARCRTRAVERGLAVSVHQADMRDFSLPRRYRSIFLAGASFNLLGGDDDARRALACVHRHLLPGGTVLIALECPDVGNLAREVGHVREAPGERGATLRCGIVAAELAADGRTVVRRLRYEREAADGSREVLERNWRLYIWRQPEFTELLEATAFVNVRLRAVGGGPAAPEAAVFVALASRPDPA